ncbi:MAG: barstar family protein [Chloroflexi bacterium]|nr:MAG: barstar family protein [Chloroflexota bacterium]
MTWIDWPRMLPEIPRGWTPRIIPLEDHERIARRLEEIGFVVLHLTDPMKSERDFHTAIARLLEFPDYYGKNWDAFHDSVADWARRDDQPTAILWSGWEDWLRSDLGGFLHTVAMLVEVNQLPRETVIFMPGPMHLDFR